MDWYKDVQRYGSNRLSGTRMYNVMDQTGGLVQERYGSRSWTGAMTDRVAGKVHSGTVQAGNTGSGDSECLSLGVLEQVTRYSGTGD